MAKFEDKNLRPIPVLFHESYFNEFYGAQNGLYNLLRCIDRNHFSPLVVCPSDGVFPDRVRELGIEVVIVPLPLELLSFGGKLLRSSFTERVGQLARLFPQIIQLVRLIQSRNIQLMHCNTIRSMLSSGIAARLSGIPLIWHVKGDGSHGYLDYAAFILSDKIVTISDDVTHYLKQRPFWNASGKIVTVRDGIPLDRFNLNVSGRTVRQEMDFQEQDLVVGTVGALSPRKGHEFFIHMAKNLAMKYPNVKFMIVGDITNESYATFKQHLQELAQDLTNSGRLVYLGWRDDMPEVYAAMDVFVLASSVEGLALVVLEAMALAKPIVRTLAAGANDTVMDGETGYLVPVDNLTALTSAVEKLVSDHALRLSMGAAARRRVVSIFSAERMAREMEQIFSDCLSIPVEGNHYHFA